MSRMMCRAVSMSATGVGGADAGDGHAGGVGQVGEPVGAGGGQLAGVGEQDADVAVGLVAAGAGGAQGGQDRIGGLPGGVHRARWRAGVFMRGHLPVQSWHSPSGARDAVGLFGAAGGAGAPGGQGLGQGGELGGGGLPFGQGQVGAVEVGDAQAAPPQDLGDGGLAAGAQPLGAELAEGEQVLRCPVVGVGGDAVAAPVGVVELDVDAPGRAPSRVGMRRLEGRVLLDCMSVRVLSRDGLGRQGPGCWQAKDRPRAVSGREIGESASGAGDRDECA